MGELIIHIDQESGAVIKAAQILDSTVKEILETKIASNPTYLDDLIPTIIIEELERSDPDAAAQWEADKLKINEWLSIDGECISLTVTLPPLGNLFRSAPSLVEELLKIRDEFQRFIPLPVELWEKPGNTVCTINVGGVIHRCVH
jgi:hypothetical protein